MYKENFKFENYLRILEDKDIYALCKLRTTNNKLAAGIILTVPIEYAQNVII